MKAITLTIKRLFAGRWIVIMSCGEDWSYDSSVQETRRAAEKCLYTTREFLCTAGVEVESDESVY